MELWAAQSYSTRKSSRLWPLQIFRTCAQFKCCKTGITTGGPRGKQWKRSGSAANVRWILGSLIQTYEENETSLGESKLKASTEPAERIEHLKEFMWPKVAVYDESISPGLAMFAPATFPNAQDFAWKSSR